MNRFTAGEILSSAPADIERIYNYLVKRSQDSSKSLTDEVPKQHGYTYERLSNLVAYMYFFKMIEATNIQVESLKSDLKEWITEVDTTEESLKGELTAMLENM